jgi:hypothetical protein
VHLRHEVLEAERDHQQVAPFLKFFYSKHPSPIDEGRDKREAKYALFLHRLELSDPKPNSDGPTKDKVP